MDNIEHKRGKIYYSMGEVAEMFDVKPSLIRFWEKKFDILKPHKNKKGNRMFTPEDVDNFRMIYHLVKEKGMTLEGARLRMRGESGEELTRTMEIIDRLQRMKALLMEVRQSLMVGEGISDDYWERDDEPVIDVDEAQPGVAAAEAESAEPGSAELGPVGLQEPSVEEPVEDDPWGEEPAVEDMPVEESVDEESAEDDPAEDDPAEDDSVEESAEEEDDEFGFGRRDEDIPDPFEYEPAEDYPAEPAVEEVTAVVAEPALKSEPAVAAESAPQPGKAAEVPAPKPRRKRAARSSNTLRLDDDAQEQAPKPKFIEQTLF